MRRDSNPRLPAVELEVIETSATSMPWKSATLAVSPLHLITRRAERTMPSALRHPAAFETEPARLSGSLSRWFTPRPPLRAGNRGVAEDGAHDAQCLMTPSRLPSGAGTPVRFILPSGERSARCPRPHDRASLSKRARRACPVHSPLIPAYRSGDSNPDHPQPECGASASWTRTACERLTGIEPATPALGMPCSAS